MSRLIATVYLPGTGINRAVPTGGDRKIEFRGGAAFVTDERDMPAALAMAGAIVEVEPRWIDFLGAWAAKCSINTPAIAQAKVNGPEADDIAIGPAPSYEVTRLGPPPVETPKEPPARNLGTAWATPRRAARAAAPVAAGG